MDRGREYVHGQGTGISGENRAGHMVGMVYVGGLQRTSNALENGDVREKQQSTIPLFFRYKNALTSRALSFYIWLVIYRGSPSFLMCTSSDLI